MRFFSIKDSYCRACTIAALSLTVAGCASVAVNSGTIRPPDPSIAYDAIEAEPTVPSHVEVVDFEFAPSSVIENRSVFHRAVDLFLPSSAEQRRIAIGRGVAETLSKQTARRLTKTGIGAIRIASDDDAPLTGNFLLVTGRLLDVNEGNRFTRVAFGLGLGESRLSTQVHVFRVKNEEKAEVLSFTTYADSGKMPGIAASVGVGELLLGPITLLTTIKETFSSGQKIYTSQIDYLASQTGNQIAAYLSQYFAAEHWIPQDKVRSVHLSSRVGTAYFGLDRPDQIIEAIVRRMLSGPSGAE